MDIKRAVYGYRGDTVEISEHDDVVCFMWPTVMSKCLLAFRNAGRSCSGPYAKSLLES